MVIDCVLNHEELAIRVCCPRWRTVSLHNISVSLGALVDGRTIPLKLFHGVEKWPVWVGGALPMTIRHGNDLLKQLALRNMRGSTKIS